MSLNEHCLHAHIGPIISDATLCAISLPPCAVEQFTHVTYKFHLQIQNR